VRLCLALAVLTTGPNPTSTSRHHGWRGGVILDATIVRGLLVPALVGFRALELMAARVGDVAAWGPAAAGGLG